MSAPTIAPGHSHLQIVHAREPLAPADPVSAPTSHQGELPLRWPADRQGELAAARLGRSPQIPLDPGIPRPEPFVAHAATLVADVLAGARPATQLARIAILDVQQRLARRCALRAATQPWSGRPARVSSTSTMVVSSCAAQVVVVFFIGPRAHAAALRMEYRHRRWLITDVESPA
jgi:hypothetical protein